MNKEQMCAWLSSVLKKQIIGYIIIAAENNNIQGLAMTKAGEKLPFNIFEGKNI